MSRPSLSGVSPSARCTAPDNGHGLVAIELRPDTWPCTPWPASSSGSSRLDAHVPLNDHARLLVHVIVVARWCDTRNSLDRGRRRGGTVNPRTPRRASAPRRGPVARRRALSDGTRRLRTRPTADSARRSGSSDGGGECAAGDSSAVDSREDLLCWIARRSGAPRAPLRVPGLSAVGGARDEVRLELLSYDFSFSSALFVASMRFRRFRISKRSFFCFRSSNLSHRCFSFT